MKDTSINIDELLAQRITSPLHLTLETKILDQARSTPQEALNIEQPERQSRHRGWLEMFNLASLFNALNVSRAIPLLASAMVVALGINLYAPIDHNEPGVPVLTPLSSATELAQLEFQEIWLLQDEMGLL